MKVLLDTHAFLWAIREPERLPKRVVNLLTSDDTEACLSAISLWEIALKIQAGKLDLPEEAAFFAEHMAELGVQTLPIHVAHVNRVFVLPHHHRDPFDRLLVAQAQTEGLPIVTADPAIRRYEVKVLW
jgi:PIN domain nuclease of toxin-antitoxin system